MAPKIRTTSRDADIVRLLNPERYTYLPSNWISALVGGNEFRFAKRLRLLSDGLPERTVAGNKNEPRPGLGYLARHFEFYRHRVYSRTEKGDTFVNEPNPHRSKQPFAHQVLQDLVHASIELGAKHPDFELIDWPKLRDLGWTERGQQKYVPDKTLSHEDPHLIRLPSGRKSRGDGAPFLLKHGKGQLFVLAKEIDRGTEPLTTTHESRRNIKQRLLQYKEVFDSDLYREHYGFPNSIVMFVFTRESRLASFLELAKDAEIFGAKGRCPYIVGYHWKDWANERSYPPATDYIFTEAGKRLGYPDFRLSKFWEA